MKERLTGAIILVVLIVLLVPELLTGPIRPKSAPAASSTAASLPAIGGGRAAHAQPPLRSYTLTLNGTPQPPRDAAVLPAQASAQPGASSPDSSTESSAANPGEDSAANPTENPTQSSAESSGRSRGESSPESAAETPQGSSAPQRVAAESRGLQAAKPAPHTAVREASLASSGGWVVQLGSFASRQNADRLARSLQRRGFRMSVSSARAGSRVLWRVRAGPAHDRSGAEHLAARLRALGHRGELLPVR